MNATEERQYNIIRDNIIDYLEQQKLTGILSSEEIADRMLNSCRKSNPTILRRIIQKTA